jgi:hypothetical protein
MDEGSKERRMLRTVTAAIAALLLGAAGTAPQRQAGLTCTNPASGWRWEIKVDYMRRTVDSYAADINADKISWYDPRDGGNYTLERNSGDLSAAFASSTGGYILNDHCALEATH